jgi:ABC-type uncharacterized transport system substrate-binding protein
MKRREVITLIGGAAVAWPTVARAQQPKVATVGVLVRSAPGWQQFWQSFPAALSDLGYIEGKNIQFEFRSDQGQISRLPELAAELVGLKVNVISLARPGGNVTGNSSLTAELSAKTVQLIRDMVPSAQRVAALANAPDPFSKSFLKQIQLAGEATGMAIDPIMIHSTEELDAAFPAMERSRPAAVIVQPSLPTKRVAELALTYRIPAVCAWRDFAHDGGLASYFGAEGDMYQRAAVLVEKILNGAQPSELPVEQPTKFELVINLKTAKALGLDVPPTLLARADEVIE